MAIQINLGERLIRLADKVLSKNSNETIGHTGGITNATANDTYVPTTKAVKEYVDDKFNGHTHLASEVTTINPDIRVDFYTHDASYDTDIINRLTNDYGISPSDDLNNYATYVNATLNSKAPYSHSINDTRYGAASSTNYGHIRVMDNLTSTGTTDALSANQGKELKTLVDAKVPIVDIKDDLTSSDTNKPLSANQGKELKTLVDTKVPIADIQDNLTSTDTNKPLSAKQGRILKSSVDSKANKNHTHANISDSGWQNVVFESGFQNYDTNHPVRYRRIGKIVHLEGIIKNTNAFTPGTTEKKVAFIDDVYCRPSYPQTALMQGSDGNKFLLTINPTGDIDVSRYGTTTATTEVTAGRWLNCYATWMVETENISVETSIIESEDGLNYFLDTYYSSDSGNSGGIDDIINDGEVIDDNPNSNDNNDNETPYETFYPYAIQLKNATNNGGINNKNIQWHIDNTQQTSSITENNGYAFFKIPYTTWSNKGNHTFTFKFEEDETYRTSSMSTTINYESVTTPTMIVGSILTGPTFSGRLLYEKGTINDHATFEGLSNKTIKCYVNNSLKSTTTTNESGLFSISMGNISNGASIKIVFEGDMPYRETTYNTTYNSGSIST